MCLSFCHDFGNLDDGHHGLLHGAYGDELVAAMEVDATGKDVGAGESLEGELCTVGTATDGLDLGFYVGLAHGLASDVDDIHHGLYHLAHVLVLVGKLDADDVGAIFLVQGLYATLE